MTEWEMDDGGLSGYAVTTYAVCMCIRDGSRDVTVHSINKVIGLEGGVSKCESNDK